jgi:hypothetical protein
MKYLEPHTLSFISIHEPLVCPQRTHSKAPRLEPKREIWNKYKRIKARYLPMFMLP